MKKYGRWSLVTGASSGIGEAYAKNIAKKGYNLILISNDSTNLERVKSEILIESPSCEVLFFNVDFKDQDKLRLFLETNSEIRQVRLIINAAGVGLIGKIEDYSLSDYLDIMSVNAMTPFIISLHFIKRFKMNSEEGAVINVTTANTEIGLPTPYSSVYTPGKIFVKFFTESVFFELAKAGIDILNVSCGPTLTNFQASAKTRVLPWCETPDNVVEKSFKQLSRKPTITTNFVTSIFLVLFKILPLSRMFKIRIAGYYFGTVLGKIDSKEVWGSLDLKRN